MSRSVKHDFDAAHLAKRSMVILAVLLALATARPVPSRADAGIDVDRTARDDGATGMPMDVGAALTGTKTSPVTPSVEPREVLKRVFSTPAVRCHWVGAKKSARTFDRASRSTSGREE